jgi:hypothetical protein
MSEMSDRPIPDSRKEKIVHPSGDDGGDGSAWVPEDRSHKITAPPSLKKDGTKGGLAKIASGDFLNEPVNILESSNCVVDGAKINVMSFKGTGVCSEWCRKRRDNEITEEEYLQGRFTGGR